MEEDLSMRKSSSNLMRKIFYLALSSILLACNTNSDNSNSYVSSYEDPNYLPSDSDSVVVSSESKGYIEFTNSSFDFGNIEEGKIIDYKFEFVNNGESPVIVSRVVTSCGCTTSDFTSTPVLPGKTGYVTIKFDSNGQSGKQQKIITVQSNAENNIETIEIKGTVNKK